MRGLLRRRGTRVAATGLALVAAVAGAHVAVAIGDASAPVSAQEATDQLADVVPDAVEPADPLEADAPPPSVEPTATGFAVDETESSITLPERLAGGAQIDSAIGPLRVAPIDAPSADVAGTPVADDHAVMYPNSAPSQDTLLKPETDAVESYTTLRGAEAPEDFRWRISSPGAPLRLVIAADGFIEVKTREPDPGESPGQDDDSSGEREMVVATIDPLWAIDADKQSVPLDVSVDGAEIHVSLRHRGQDYAYPIVLDPRVASGNPIRMKAEYRPGADRAHAAAGDSIACSVNRDTHPVLSGQGGESKTRVRAGVHFKCRQIPPNPNTAAALASLHMYGEVGLDVMNASGTAERLGGTRPYDAYGLPSSFRKYSYFSDCVPGRHSYRWSVDGTAFLSAPGWEFVSGGSGVLSHWPSGASFWHNDNCNAAGQWRLEAKAGRGGFRQLLKDANDLPAGTSFYGWAAHHIIPAADRRTGFKWPSRVQAIGRACGLQPNSVANGIFLRGAPLEPSAPGFNQGAYNKLATPDPHDRTYHGSTLADSYYQWVYNRLRGAITDPTLLTCDSATARSSLREIKRLLRNGKFPREVHSAPPAPAPITPPSLDCTWLPWYGQPCIADPGTWSGDATITYLHGYCDPAQVCRLWDTRDDSPNAAWEVAAMQYGCDLDAWGITVVAEGPGGMTLYPVRSQLFGPYCAS